MTTTRYFEVKVTGCSTCPHKAYDSDYRLSYCLEAFNSGTERYELCINNMHKLTDSCPMAAQHKESAMK